MRCQSIFICVFVFISLWLTSGNGLLADSKSTESADKENSNKEIKYLFREQIVVTATISPKELKNCSDSLQIVDSRQLQFLPAANALAALGGFPGLFVQRSGDFGRADLDIRGLGQNGRRIAVLVNGRPEKMGLYGCAVTHAFPLDNVERIEVIKGPASVLYGGEAMGGAVNIITRRPGHKWDGTIRFQSRWFSVQLQGQQVNTYFAAVNSQKPIPAYFVLNSRLIGKFIRNIDLILDLNNILNEEYVIYGEFPGVSAGTFVMPGRNVSIGLR